jgi:hypothetical protein
MHIEATLPPFEIKLDLGAGQIVRPGFRPMGRDYGSEIYPLPYADETVSEITASHVLEHFSQAEVPLVIKEWVRVLKKGAKLRIAVPDFAKVAEDYLNGAYAPTESFVLGGQIDQNDFHKSLFDRDKLRKLLAAENLVLIQPWTSEIADCAAYPISLNLEARKPHMSEIKVSGAMSVPRLGFFDNFFACMESSIACKVKLRRHGGAFWGQSLTNVFEKIIEEDESDAILAIDYDSVFEPKQLARLMQIMMLHPEIDALAPIQSSRHMDRTLFTIKDSEDNENQPAVPRTRFETETTPIATAHFGLTLIRTEKLKTLSKPWFHSRPSPAGDWHDGKLDEDIRFWELWRNAGHSLHLANRVVIGHMEIMNRLPDTNLEVFYQPMNDFHKSGFPDAVWK